MVNSPDKQSNTDIPQSSPSRKPIAIIIFGILLILGALYQVQGLNLDAYRLFFQPLPEQLIISRYFISIAMLVLGFITGIGVMFRKNIFRKSAIFIGCFILYTYVIELPLLVFKNISQYVDQQVVAILSTTPNITEAQASWSLWSVIVVSFAVEIIFSICLIFVFTRPKIKGQFK